MIYNSLEVKRQLFHLVAGLILAFLVYYSIITSFALLVLILLHLLFSLLSLRYSVPLFGWFLNQFERNDDLSNFPGKGSLSVLVGAFIVVFLFSKEIAVASLLILAVGDSIASLVGTHYKKRNHPLNDLKSLEGSFLGFLFAFVFALLVIPWLEALLASLFAMIFESLEIKIFHRKLNDNITIPIISAVVISLLRII